jgi:glucokinase
MSFVLAGDIGGTNTRLAVFKVEEDSLALCAQQDYLNREHKSPQEIVLKFLQQARVACDGAALAVAGPVLDNKVSGTNLPWPVDADAITLEAGLPKVVLLNDLMALARGIGELRAEDIEVLHAGEEDLDGNGAVVAAGTGLGEAGLLRSGKGFIPFPSEGGHSDFGPNSELEARLYLHLRQRFGHVSYERILSGQGIENVYAFMRDDEGFAEPKELAAELAACSDRAASISRHALAGTHKICVRTLEVFVSVLAAEAGNLALRLFATGGVYIGGGIAPKVAPFLRQPEFLEAYRQKGRMSQLVERVPLRLVTNQHTGLIGAAAHARDLLQKGN